MSYILRIWGTSILEKGIRSKGSENCIEEKTYPKVRDRSEHVAPFFRLILFPGRLRKLRKH